MAMIGLIAARLQDVPAPVGAAEEALILSVVGITVVFAVLAAIGVLIAALDRLLTPKPSTEPAAAAVPAEDAAPARGTVEPQTLAVLTAAAYAAVGRPVRVRRVTFINEDTVSAWKDVGRVGVHASHNIRRTY